MTIGILNQLTQLGMLEHILKSPLVTMIFHISSIMMMLMTVAVLPLV